ncbi:MAG: hypothetical protein RLY23_662 [Actinomycetota bacterium]
MAKANIDLSASTRDRLLAAAVSQLAQGGADSFNVEDILAESMTSRSSLYHFFGGRDELLRAAEGRLYLNLLIGEGPEPLRDAAACKTREEFREFLIANVVRSATDPETVRARRSRFAILARTISRGRPNAGVIESQRLFLDAMTKIVSDARDRGLVRGDLDCEAYACFFHGLTMPL